MVYEIEIEPNREEVMRENEATARRRRVLDQILRYRSEALIGGVACLAMVSLRKAAGN